jgi:hypothetical protein
MICLGSWSPLPFIEQFMNETQGIFFAFKLLRSTLDIWEQRSLVRGAW